MEVQLMGDPAVDGFVQNQSQKAPIVSEDEIVEIIRELESTDQTTDESLPDGSNANESSANESGAANNHHDHVVQGPAPVIGLVVDPKYGSCIKGVHINGFIRDDDLIKFAIEVLAKSKMYTIQGLNSHAIKLLDGVISGTSLANSETLYDKIRSYYAGQS